MLITQKEQKFKRRLKNILENEDIQQQRDLIRNIVADFEWTLEDCAAALVYLSQPNLYQKLKKPDQVAQGNDDFEVPLTITRDKTVRYRLNVGSKHQVTREEIENVLVSESGVDRKRIGRIDIRHHYTIVELPEGMPADIFQLLSEVNLRQQKLNIKRLKPQRNFRRYRKYSQ